MKTAWATAVAPRRATFRMSAGTGITHAEWNRESEATTLAEIIAEMRASTSSEREGRAIDHDSAGSMERKKKEGYF